MINIVLFEPSIPGNTGNIMRTCVATNTKLHLIKPLGFSLDEKAIKRSGVNYINNCNYIIYENINDFYNKNSGTYYFLTRYGKKSHSEFSYKNVDENIYFIFGNESTGIPKNILSPNFDKCIRIPMTDKVRALNLSNAVAITIYEAMRQRDYNNLKLTEPHKSVNYILEK